MARPQRGESGEPRPFIDQIAFGMHLEPQAFGPRAERIVQMIELEAEARGNDHETRLQLDDSEPAPLGVWIWVQVPDGTYFHAFFW